MQGTPAAPMDLTGYSAAMDIKKSAKSADVLASVTCTIDPDQSGANKGKIFLRLETNEYDLLPWDTVCRYDLKLFIPNGVSLGVDHVEYWLEGEFLVTNRITA